MPKVTEDGQGIHLTRSHPEFNPELVAPIKEHLEKAGIPPVIYRVDIGSDTFVFRPLYGADIARLNAIRQSRQNMTEADYEKEVCKQGLIWPDEYQTPQAWLVQKAGYPNTLCRYIQAYSGYMDPSIDSGIMPQVVCLADNPGGPMPSDEIIAELKAKFNWDLYLVQIANENFIVRPISDQEGRLIRAAGPNAEVELAKRGTVWSRFFPEPLNCDDVIAGALSTLCDVISRISGYDAQAVVKEL